MAVVTPPLYLNIDSEYTAADLGLPYRDIVAEGVAGSSDMAVSERGAGANMSVDVAAGVCWVKGDEAARQPTYRCYNDGTVNLAIAAADGSNARIDIVIAEVRDSAFAGVSTDWRLRVVTGTPAGSPSAPSTPNNAVKLANISVPASDTTIADAQITDTRPRAGLQSSLGVPTVSALPASPYDGQVIDYLADATNGVVWRLKYRAASASAYKWEVVGGRPLFAEVSTQQTTSSTSYADLGTTGPAVTLPLAGDYDVTIGMSGWSNTNGGSAVMSYAIGGTGASDNDFVRHQEPAGSNTGPAHVVRTRRKTGLSAVTLTSKYKTGGAGTATIEARFMAVAPVRVG